MKIFNFTLILSMNEKLLNFELYKNEKNKYLKKKLNEKVILNNIDNVLRLGVF